MDRLAQIIGKLRKPSFFWLFAQSRCPSISSHRTLVVLVFARVLTTEQGKNTNLKVLSASGHQIPNESLYKLGKAIAMAASQETASISSLAIGDNSMGHTGVLAFTKGLAEGGGNTLLEEIDLSWKGMYV